LAAAGRCELAAERCVLAAAEKINKARGV